ncbi:glycosyltransferase [Thermocladium modestius]|nr:glycosyltransferase [Thermocladium modestius]
MILEVAIALITLHFAVPIAYYATVIKWMKRPWPDVANADLPSVSIIIPTFNEADVIGKRIINIAGQGYPLDKMNVILVDSSSDGTADEAERQARASGLRLSILREEERRGKAEALNAGLKLATGDVVVIADADAFWGANALPNAMSWFSNPKIGAVSCVKTPLSGNSTELSYRNLYNVLRVGESKKFATPIFHGELAAFRRDLLMKLGGFPTDIGADDSHTATRIAAMGFRSIIPENVTCAELVPTAGFSKWKVRRAQHLIQNFIKAIRLEYPSDFKPIIYTEFYLHVINPWILAAAVVLLLMNHGVQAMALLAAGLAAAAWGPYRSWMVQQLYLLVASVRNLRSKELMWDKQKKPAAPKSDL